MPGRVQNRGHPARMRSLKRISGTNAATTAPCEQVGGVGSSAADDDSCDKLERPLDTVLPKRAAGWQPDLRLLNPARNACAGFQTIDTAPSLTCNVETLLNPERSNSFFALATGGV
jgi:hypothetical protein